jgi:uncharacterized membrane protein YagU involved in acid resistance
MVSRGRGIKNIVACGYTSKYLDSQAIAQDMDKVEFINYESFHYVFTVASCVIGKYFSARFPLTHYIRIY